MKIVSAVLSFALGAVVAAPSCLADERRLVDPSGYFKDLPGVMAPDMQQKAPEYRCTTATRSFRNRDDVGFSDSLPVLVYRCTRDGVTFESRNPPLTGSWYPGVNPRNIEK